MIDTRWPILIDDADGPPLGGIALSQVAAALGLVQETGGGHRLNSPVAELYLACTVSLRLSMLGRSMVIRLLRYLPLHTLDVKTIDCLL